MTALIFSRGKAARQALLTALLIACSTGVQSAEMVVGDAVYVGKRSTDAAVDTFLGIPFAAPPVGNLRWQAPQPLELLPGRQLAQNFKAACAQGPHMVGWYRGLVTSFGGDPDSFPVPEFSEDCLYLNIWTPVSSEPALKPVVVYIHGGSNKGGWAYEPNYIGENLARLGVVVVSIPYRLGVLGFFSHPELQDKNPGLLDQIAALQWVRRHIQAVGGNPDNVTLMGESAGANNIDHLLASPTARGLFSRVIHQSGGWSITSSQPRSDAERVALKLQEVLLGDTGNLEALTHVPLEELLSAAENAFADHYFDPVVDGHSMTVAVNDALLHNTLEPVDLLIGSNTDEWLMYLEDGVSLAGYLADNFATEPERAKALRSLLPDDLSDKQAVDRLITAQQFVCPSLKLAEYASENGAQTWLYYFAREREGERATAMGAYHGAELPYVFGTHDEWLPTSSDDLRLTSLIMRYWVNFIRSGNPNDDDLPAWPAFALKGENTLLLDIPTSSVEHPSTVLCRRLAAG